MAKKKRHDAIATKPLVGIYNNENLSLNKPLRLLPNIRVSIEVKGKQNGNNGRQQISGVVRPQIKSTIRRLARLHFEMEAGIDRIIWFRGGLDRKKIRLIEVNRNTLPTGSVMIFPVGQSTRFPISAELAEVTPEEWKKIRAGKIALPPEWSLENAVVFEREKAEPRKSI